MLKNRRKPDPMPSVSGETLDPAQPLWSPFVDAAGYTWRLRLTIDSAETLAEQLGVDFCDDAGKAMATLGGNARKLKTALWLLLAEQAEAAGVSPRDFAKAFDGDTIERAVRALAEATINFTRPAMRPAMRSLLERMFEVEVRQGEAARRKVESPAADAAIHGQLAAAEKKLDATFKRLAAGEEL